jgi:hypothetical protein
MQEQFPVRENDRNRHDFFIIPGAKASRTNLNEVLELSGIVNFAVHPSMQGMRVVACDDGLLLRRPTLS